MPTNIDWCVGVEVELLAPPGKSRLDLALAIARARGGQVRRFFHPQSEPSKVPGTPVFHNLTLGFEVLHHEGGWIAKCVDDLTLQSDLARDARPKADWYRILSDDERLLRLIQEQADASLPIDQVLAPIGRLFATEPSPGPGGMIRVHDKCGSPIAIAAPLPGERERPCELVTAPLKDRHQEQLDELLGLARSLGFTAPAEGATHLHFDATALQTAKAFANLVQLLWVYNAALKSLMKTNPQCVRLGAWPATLMEMVSEPDFAQKTWPQVQSLVKSVELTKYCDFNLIHYLKGRPEQNTLEVRILPVSLSSRSIIDATNLFVAILKRATGPRIPPRKEPRDGSLASQKSLLDELALSQDLKERWLANSPEDFKTKA